MRKQFVRLAATLALLLFSQLSFAESKKIGILVFDGVLTSDVTAPLEVFGVASRKTWFSDYTPIVINVANKSSMTTEEGLSLNSPYWIGNAPELDVLIVPSSYDMDPLIENIQLIQFIKNTAKNAEWMASNCSGSFLLGKAGLLDGLKATTWAGGEKDLARTFPSVKVQYDQNVVIDGNVITSNGSLVSYQAALVLLSKLASASKANEVAKALQYTRFSTKKFIL
ncbi:DJ-1/PfpI family protein [Neptuniibacter sp. PT8_73]|uniref:DJ-1/PfpI family protein n=1 Tax=Neptuniibacter sp. PT8_73 TaxID=3398206 RepID=UPI0039F4501F